MRLGVGQHQLSGLAREILSFLEAVEIVIMDDAILFQPASSQYKVEAQARGHQEICFFCQSSHSELEIACALNLHLLSFPSHQDVAVGVWAQGDVVAEDADVGEVFRNPGVHQGWDLADVDNYRERDVGGSGVACRGYFYRQRRSSSAGTVAAYRPAAEFPGSVLALGQSLCQFRAAESEAEAISRWAWRSGAFCGPLAGPNFSLCVASRLSCTRSACMMRSDTVSKVPVCK
jgi:hypothetical protein